MQLKISDDGPPLYLQIVEQVRHRILSGQLADGDELPAIRSLAERVRVNPNTVARAYRELEMAGLVEKRRTRGTFVRAQGQTMTAAQRRDAIIASVDQCIGLARGLGFSDQEVVAVFHERWRDHQPEGVTK
ncbi:MAG: GntR family transcriptional regulator [Planctomycetota bacterium]